MIRPKCLTVVEISARVDAGATLSKCDGGSAPAIRTDTPETPVVRGGRTMRVVPLLMRALAASVLVVLALPTAAGSQGAGCTVQTVGVGIVKAKSCFTSADGPNGATIYTATGPATDQVDLNGFIIRLGTGDSLTIN